VDLSLLAGVDDLVESGMRTGRREIVVLTVLEKSVVSRSTTPSERRGRLFLPALQRGQEVFVAIVQ